MGGGELLPVGVLLAEDLQRLGDGLLADVRRVATGDIQPLPAGRGVPNAVDGVLTFSDLGLVLKAAGVLGGGARHQRVGVVEGQGVRAVHAQPRQEQALVPLQKGRELQDEVDLGQVGAELLDLTADEAVGEVVEPQVGGL